MASMIHTLFWNDLEEILKHYYLSRTELAHDHIHAATGLNRLFVIRLVKHAAWTSAFEVGCDEILRWKIVLTFQSRRQQTTASAKSGRGKMFALLTELHRKSAADMVVFSGLLQVQVEHGESLFSSPSPELLAKEKQKADQGYCETAFWNCSDLCKLFLCMTTCCISCQRVWVFVGESATL
jgi:hypothetical protein